MSILPKSGHRSNESVKFEQYCRKKTFLLVVAMVGIICGAHA